MAEAKSTPRFSSLKARFVKHGGMPFLDLNLSRNDSRKLKAMAKAAGQNTSDFVRRLVEEEWNRRQKPQV